MLAAGLGVGAVTLTTVGQTFSPLGAVSMLSPRHPRRRPAGACRCGRRRRPPRSPTSARTTAWSSTGPNRLELTLDDLAAFPQRTERLPITCVEGWSAYATWTGVRLGDLLEEAGLPRDTEVDRRVAAGARPLPDVAWSPRRMPAARARCWPPGSTDRRCDPDHGYPVRLIAPNRPGVMQTKWVTKVTPV